MDKKRMRVFLVSLCILCLTFAVFISCKKSEEISAGIERGAQQTKTETRKEKDERMAWWREARFGLFIHWGLYAIPAGEWKGETSHAEWILTTAQIPVKEYENFAPQFNPVKFDPQEWVSLAKDAGMKYIVITSKHHDGFCLFDSKLTDYDVMDATPFKRDILKELADECQKQGMKMCWYHSIMDWHHPDYLPRRDWETRSAEGADFERYVNHLKGQVKELLTNYGEIGVMWFDGEWEYTWTPERGIDLYDYVRSLAPAVIVNNRVGKGRAGMAGTFDPDTSSGDFGTPEQEIPPTGLGYDWETCMTMNDHWGYNKNDNNWKSAQDLIRKLVDIASKGGNFLLNVGPTAEGLFPQPSIDRLNVIGDWMKVNGESIYGTTASLFENLEWGRSTTKDNTIFLHVFDWPQDGQLYVPGLVNKAQRVYMLADPRLELSVNYQAGAAVLALPEKAPDPNASVIALEFQIKPEVVRTPRISAESDIFHKSLEVSLSSHLDRIEIHYTLDGSHPGKESPIYRNVLNLEDTTTVKAQIFRDGQAISSMAERTFQKKTPRRSLDHADGQSGLRYALYSGQWETIPDFDKLIPELEGTVKNFDISPSLQKENFGFRFSGFITVPQEGLYRFFVSSDDGSRLYIGDELVVDNDGLHGSTEASGRIILEKGFHPIRVDFFQRTGGVDFAVSCSGPGLDRQPIPAGILFH
jgi:alpha-L-fucosidase